MAISTIKYDENNKPKRAKYQIVILGNLDYHHWSKESTAAPVMSQLELRLLTSLAVSLSSRHILASNSLIIWSSSCMGLQSSPNSPCLFVGTLIPGEAPIYVGIYVDDIIYFSPSAVTKRKFEELLSTLGSIDFMGQVTHFLGIEFTGTDMMMAMLV
jgi:hypothetical protein